MTLENENVVGELDLLLINMPEDKNITPMEKLRWLYIKLGKIFSYNYRIVNDPKIATQELDFENNYIGRYETCVQISEIFNIMANQIPGVKSKIIERKMDYRGHQQLGLNHLANEVTIDNEGTYILDLTVDLYLIQSGFQTKCFGLESIKDHISDLLYEQKYYDIIPLPLCREMDEKLGLLSPDGYTDEKVTKCLDEFSKQDFSNKNDEDIIKYKINYLSKLIPQFRGHHEGKLLLNKLIKELLNVNYREYNLTYRNDSTDQIVTCFVLNYENVEIWLLYSNVSGITYTSKEKIEHMLNNGWTTRSNMFNNMFKKM